MDLSIRIVMIMELVTVMKAMLVANVTFVLKGTQDFLVVKVKVCIIIQLMSLLLKTLPPMMTLQLKILPLKNIPNSLSIDFKVPFMCLKICFHSIIMLSLFVSFRRMSNL